MTTAHRCLGIAATVLASISLFAFRTAQAQEQGTVTVDVARCLALESEAERRECFAAQVDEVLDETQGAANEAAASRSTGNAAADAAPRPAETGQSLEPEVERLSRAERRALRRAEKEQAEAQARAADASEEPEAGEYFGTIVEIRERLPSAYIITLDNGQVWQQTEPKQYPLRPGLEVRIYPTRWGNRYRLTGRNSGGHIQVQRLR